MIRTFKILSVLLSYPTEDIRAAAPELRAVIEGEGLVPERLRPALFALIDEMAQRDLFDLQERYVALFDRTRSLSLHLFEHVHGESRDRGQAMVDLMDMYESHGLFIDARELPDYLPLFLEFLALLPIREGRELLGQPLHVIAALGTRLRKRDSVYAAVFDALDAVAVGKAEPAMLSELLEQPEDDPDDLEALDRIWEEEAVTFGPGAGMAAPDGGCPAARASLSRMDMPQNPTLPQEDANHG